MEEQSLITPIYKILNKTLPSKFPFIDGVKDIILIVNDTKTLGDLKLKIILNKDWVNENFLEESMTYIKDDIESDGYSLLSPFTVNSFSKGLIHSKEIKNYISSILKVLGLDVDILYLNEVYIIE